MAANRVYYANQPFPCAQCGKTVHTGETFRYRGLPGGGVEKVCYPECDGR